MLAAGDKRWLVFLYRRVTFERHIRRRENVDFLAGFGYREGPAEAMLDRLAERIGMYAGQETVFPHEIGVFLDYPLADVEGSSGMPEEIICCQATGRYTMTRTGPGSCSGPMTGPGTVR